MSDPALPDALPPDAADAPDANEESPLEEAAREKLGLRRYDCPALYRETAEAATDTDLPFWSVLLLSGAIATLGLALDATAVVIGAMLVAPLLGPLLGLSLALAVGDGRLAIQTALTILIGAAGVTLLAAGLTLLLPFDTVTPEIAARTRPTTLDLAIAIASGLAGAVVTASREQRLSSSIPGVAIAVALIPPLGVAGFGIGTGWQWPLIRGALLLFGANLAGIVLSGMLVFLLIGMHRQDVVEAARRWHATAEGSRTGLTGALERAQVFRRVRVFSSPGARVALILLFCVAVAVPLTTSFREIVRESRIGTAVDRAAATVELDERAFVLDRSVAFGPESARVRLRVATTEWFGPEERRAIERAATRDAGEPVAVQLEQVLASAGDLDAFAEALPRDRDDPGAIGPAAPAAPAERDALEALRQELDGTLAALAVPDSVTVVGGEIRVGAATPQVSVAYAAPRAMAPEAEAMLARQAARALSLPDGAASVQAVPLAPRPLPADPAARTQALAAARALADRFPRLRLRADSARLAFTVAPDSLAR